MRSPSLWRAAIGVLVLAAFAVPALLLVARPFELHGMDGGWTDLRQTLAGQAFSVTVADTLKISGIVGVVTVVAGLSAAWALYQLGSRFWERILLLSVVAAYSTLTAIRAMALLIALSPNHSLALLFGLFRAFPQLSSSSTGVIIGLVHFFLPMVILYFYAGLIVVPQNLVRASALSSTGFLTTLWIVYWPLLRVRLLYAGLLTFLLSLGAYITPSVLGGGGANAQMISVVIDQRIRSAGALDQGLLYGLLFSIGFALVALAVVLVQRGLFRESLGQAE
jgi:putative spermidine/putrescine transport system permease protein